MGIEDGVEEYICSLKAKEVELEETALETAEIQTS